MATPSWSFGTPTTMGRCGQSVGGVKKTTPTGTALVERWGRLERPHRYSCARTNGVTLFRAAELYTPKESSFIQQLFLMPASNGGSCSEQSRRANRKTGQRPAPKTKNTPAKVTGRFDGCIFVFTCYPCLGRADAPSSWGI
ncbi:hypothetical protein R9C00_09395 [Flammeovirgaceae bacterium SG7u.111]|nr:hypothetical protein [Flammeovirgaceae bacterium SG7u.132]WPO37663.1 hypothetical protein R9C00_09395 [Flammeovirgaceae bacterium SG7u.111]